MSSSSSSTLLNEYVLPDKSFETMFLVVAPHEHLFCFLYADCE